MSDFIAGLDDFEDANVKEEMVKMTFEVTKALQKDCFEILQKIQNH